MKRDELVRAVLRGEPRAWRALSQSLEPDLNRYFARRLDSTDIEDVYQNTLATIARKLPEFEFREKQPFMYWVYGIARLEALKARHQRRRKAAQHEAAALANPTPGTGLSARLQRLELAAVVAEETAKLPGKYRRAIENYVEGGGAATLAARENITPGAARTHLFRARLMLERRVKARRDTPRRRSSQSPPPSSPASP